MERIYVLLPPGEFFVVTRVAGKEPYVQGHVKMMNRGIPSYQEEIAFFKSQIDFNTCKCVLLHNFSTSLTLQFPRHNPPMKLPRFWWSFCNRENKDLAIEAVRAAK